MFKYDKQIKNEKLKIKNYQMYVFVLLIIAFLLLSFYPTIFELSQASKLKDQRREFILEHNYYWPDFNLYLSKIRQGYEGGLTAVERYTSESHQGSLIQIFYVWLGYFGRLLYLEPNFSYQLGRLILSPLLLLVILKLIKYYFPFRIFTWQILTFLIVVTSGSFPRFYTDNQGLIQMGRYMEWWSNIDALQRITFIPHILFGQIASFFLLYRLTMKQSNKGTMKQLFIYIILGNLTGLVFPPSLITLNGVLLLIILVKLANILRKNSKFKVPDKGEARQWRQSSKLQSKVKSFKILNFELRKATLLPRNFTLRKATLLPRNFTLQFLIFNFAFLILTLPSLLYLFFTTRQLPWSALVDFHRTHPMMVPFDQYILGTGPIFILGVLGGIMAILRRDKIWQPLVLWVVVTLSFASFFSIIKEQSPLRFTQTGLFIPLGILGTYFFQQIWFRIQNSEFRIQNLSKFCYLLSVICYLTINLFMMKVSLDWQINWITQRVNASTPDVPYPPQTMYPLKQWMNGIRWLKDNTNHNEVVLSEITAGNFIPAYSGNTVYFGQANTYDYERKQLEVDSFFKGEMNPTQAGIFLKNGQIKYIFFSVQEKELAGKEEFYKFYPFLNLVYENPLVTIYEVEPRFEA